MRSVTQAFLWEVWANGKWNLLGFAVVASILPILIFSILGEAAVVYRDNPEFVMIQFVMLQLNAFMFGVSIFLAIGSPSRLYLAPITNLHIATLVLVPGVLLIGAEVLLLGWGLSHFLGLGWVVGGHAMFAAVTWSLFQGIFLLSHRSPGWSVLASTVTITAMALWYKSLHGPTFSLPVHYWSEVSFAQLAALGCLLFVGWGLSVIGIARDRCGEVLPGPKFTIWIKQLAESLYRLFVKEDRPLRSPAEALEWYEWRQKGLALPLIVGMGMLFFVLVCTANDLDDKELVDGAKGAAALLMVASFAAGLFVGMPQVNSQKRMTHETLAESLANTPFVFGQFLGVRPVTNQQFATSILRMMIKSAALAMLVWSVLACLGMLVIVAKGQSLPAIALNEFLFILILTLFAPWIGLVIGATLGLTGRPILVASIGFGGPVGYMASATLIHELFSSSMQDWVWISFNILVAGLLVLAIITGFFIALKRRVISPAAAAQSSLFAAILAMVVFYLQPPSTGILFPYALLVVTAIAIIVSPVACMPLVIGWNRHR